MELFTLLHTQHLLLDGGLGSLLMREGLSPGEYPERWNISHRDTVRAIHRAYYDAGSHIVSTNTFGANSLKFDDGELSEVIQAAVENVRVAREESVGTQEKFIALDIGPTGKLLRPFGDLSFEDAVAVFKKTVTLGVRAGVDCILIETMSDAYETRAAVLAVREVTRLPLFVSNAYGEDGRLLTGASPAAMVAMLEGLSVDAIGANCSQGPDRLLPVIDELLSVSSTPVFFMPNAGLPTVENGEAVYGLSPEAFASTVAEAMRRGVRAAGGCCGTTPAYIRALRDAIRGLPLSPIADKGRTVASSFRQAVAFGEKPLLIGERLNPTGKKRLKEALKAGDMDYILSEAIAEEEHHADMLDINVGTPEVDEKTMLPRVVDAVQAVTPLPLVIDSADPVAMEAALRLYNGKAVVNSVSGKKESMDAVFPLVRRYGGLVICLTLDEGGIPSTADGRVSIAKRIIAEAEGYGIPKKDLVFDTLAMAVSADPHAAEVTLLACRRIREELGCHTSLGVSNISFGLPSRDAVNSAFFTLALENGLSAAIMNPMSEAMQAAYHAFCLLRGLDANARDFIAFSEAHPTCMSAPNAAPPSAKPKEGAPASLLSDAIVKGLTARAGQLAAEALLTEEPLSLVEREIIPALDRVGKGFEEKTVYLPQLLLAAEAAKAAFEEVKTAVSRTRSGGASKGAIVLATVKGDIHDIGKNIVKLLLENYGYTVYDLGRDIEPMAVVEAAEAHHAPLVGLSALMTTTLPAMEETVRMLRERVPDTRIVVGGAVLTREYAAAIGADAYGGDAMESVRYAEGVFKDKK